MQAKKALPTLLGDLQMINRFFREALFLASLKRRAIYVGWDGNENLGDEAVKDTISNALSDSVTMYPSKHVSRFARVLWNEKYDAAVLGGGTLINMGTYLERFINADAKFRCTFGTGVALDDFWAGANRHPSLVRDWLDALHATDYVSVRGPLSKQQLIDWGFEGEVEVIGDPALLFADSIIHRKKKTKVLGINAGNTRDLLWGGSDREFWSQFLTKLRVLGDSGWSFVIFSVTPNDRMFVEIACEELAGYNIRKLDYSISAKKYLEETKNVDVFVGEKLHSTILAICTYTPSIMLEYRPKCRDFMASIDSLDMLVRTDQIADYDLLGKAEALLEIADQEQNRLHEKVANMKNKLLQAAKKISSFIENTQE